MKNLIFSLFLLMLTTCAHAQIITTVAGDNTAGYNGDNILATDAELDGPIGIALDEHGNYYIADTYNNRIRKVNTDGIITTIAGNDTTAYNVDNIPATTAHLLLPTGIICDAIGNIYFADALHNRIRKIDTSGIITTIAGNGTGGYNGDNIPATNAEIQPWSVTIDNEGNTYISDWGNSRIRKVNAAGVITTIAGTGVAGYTGDSGPADTAEINTPYGIALDDTGNIYFADANENVVRKIDTSGIITTFAGGGTTLGDGGPATLAILSKPTGISIDKYNNVYIADADNNRIRQVNTITHIITTIAGDGFQGFSGDNGPATTAELFQPSGIALGSAGDAYITDFSNNRVRYITNVTAIKGVNGQQSQVSIYPNPNVGTFIIDVMSSTCKQVWIQIINAIGMVVKNELITTNAPFSIQLNQPSGIYYLSIITSQGSTTQKIIINKCC